MLVAQFYACVRATKRDRTYVKFYSQKDEKRTINEKSNIISLFEIAARPDEIFEVSNSTIFSPGGIVYDLLRRRSSRGAPQGSRVKRAARKRAPTDSE